MLKLFDSPLNSPYIYCLLIIYALTSSITVFDTRLIQGRKNGTVPESEPMLPNWVSLIAWIDWLALLALILMNWKVALIAYAIKFILSVLPVLEVVGNILMSPFRKIR